MTLKVTTKKLVAAAVLSTIAVTALVACGGDSDSDTTTATPPSWSKTTTGMSGRPSSRVWLQD